MDLARELIAAQSHRRMMDPMSFGHRVRPFVIERASLSTAAVDYPPANAPLLATESTRQRTQA